MPSAPTLAAPEIVTHNKVKVVRDDLLEGGSKIRFLHYLVNGDEVVFGGPRCGGAPWALSVLGRQMGFKVTLFYAKSKPENWHPRQRAAKANGAEIVEVPYGYISNVQKQAREYADKAGALFLPLGFDVQAASDPFIEVMRDVRARLPGQPDEVWCATGSGMLARCLGVAFPDSEIKGVAVGLATRHDNQTYPANVTILPCDYKFHEICKDEAPFPSDGNYERKAWALCEQSPAKRRLFWNVTGNME